MATSKKQKLDHPRVAVVTGAGSGIGRTCSLALARHGWRLVLAGRGVAALEDTAEKIRSVEGGSALVVPTDVTCPDSVEQLFTQCKAHYGRCDLLFNNAGRGAPAIPLEDISIEDWQSVVDVNLTGSFLCTQQAFKLMKAQQPQGGRIINNGSVSADRPRPNSSPYTATKHAITGLTKSTSLDGRAHKIAAGQINIGNAATEMTKRMENGVLQPSGRVEAEPVFDVEDVGKAIVFMADLSLESNVLEMTVMATNMPLIGRG